MFIELLLADFQQVKYLLDLNIRSIISPVSKICLCANLFTFSDWHVTFYLFKLRLYRFNDSPMNVFVNSWFIFIYVHVICLHFILHFISSVCTRLSEFSNYCMCYINKACVVCKNFVSKRMAIERFLLRAQYVRFVWKETVCWIKETIFSQSAN